MRNLVQITDHVDQGLARLKQQFQQEGTFKELIRVFLQRYQTVENALFSLLLGRFLAFAMGQMLDDIGTIVTLPRPSILTPDDEYRVLLYGRIAALNSNGTLPNLLGILGTLGATNRRIYQNFPASLTINFTPSSVIREYTNIRTILETSSASVDLNICAHGDGAFGFSDDPTALGWDEGTIGEAI
ncbi:hypothetical protein COW36_06585 [bacterium (Candidatus Blackallbacteria) CG17_big_fil_post_rev_8_21_14_2_50_48_46]|uniref:Baseplate protein J-like domain-containing protein n=1 Tax=bacterium (Candidatus Blackallbacteria) CG17_big_fil_post_rev_8_21_14_2_50_48_46 TaxID=2014261 RepID=A0A2M7G886_9BACT|nr:MAG: hypothetical protein COW64_22980 [bacterium (Candidatus Blackallbacteria) CG18_big_fil_WC_8_21_14_2_50_49_26]PIW18004.1 MAG: hypothetical protein COW36_06585 [bacterium (Candidatus Blackallbacteria) CG17_big_fil_post_rev_8_21_14_2_50_48_46]PIW49649.1 MAG: hypothetical protein COW20_05305 [bacterium (Candidatus Blackallbacteria) CG13_big_fil_rev_8_21_14_2_50_49_14]